MALKCDKGIVLFQLGNFHVSGAVKYSPYLILLKTFVADVWGWQHLSTLWIHKNVLVARRSRGSKQPSEHLSIPMLSPFWALIAEARVSSKSLSARTRPILSIFGCMMEKTWAASELVGHTLECYPTNGIMNKHIIRLRTKHLHVVPSHFHQTNYIWLLCTNLAIVNQHKSTVDSNDIWSSHIHPWQKSCENHHFCQRNPHRLRAPGTAGHVAARGDQGQEAGGRLAQQRVALQALTVPWCSVLWDIQHRVYNKGLQREKHGKEGWRVFTNKIIKIESTDVQNLLIQHMWGCLKYVVNTE